MEPDVAKLFVGMTVKISRSDGRVHNATVKSANHAKSTLNVEWSENGLTKGKELDLSDVCQLNENLIQTLKVQSQVGSSSASASTSAAVPKAEIKADLPPKMSKIPAPSEPGPSEKSVPKRKTMRQTCVFQPPELPSTSSTTAAENASGQEVPTPTIVKPSGLPSYQRRQAVNPTPSLLPTLESVSESPASVCASVAATNSCLPRAPEGNNTAKKRLSVSKKNQEIKKTKYEDLNRPNKQFYQMIEEYRETLEKVPLTLTDPVELHRICVCVRKRPLNKKEMSKKEIDVVSVLGNGVLQFHEPKQKVDLTKYLDNQLFHFDYSFDEDATNELIYRFTAKPLVKTLFEGGMATCFAYGQTGSGKTHTMGGDFSGRTQNSSNGIYALAAQDLFYHLQHRKYAGMDLCPYVTFFEIYNGKAFDLLNKKTELRVLEDEKQQVQVVGLQEMPVSSVDDVIKLIERGSACRTSGQTFANTKSSRSHAVLQIILRRHKQLHGKFSLVDLAGNERGVDVSSNDRQTMVETAEINRSLLALKECIRSLGKNSDHIPFRLNKLTQVLRDSFIGGNSRTCMIAMISPGMSSCDYTLNTLRYADRVKELNGVSKGIPQESKMSEEGCSSSEEESVHDFDTLTQISELQERLYEALQSASEIVMKQPSHDRDAEIDLFVEKLQGSCQALESAIQSFKTGS